MDTVARLLPDWVIPLTMQLIRINEVTLLLAPYLWLPQEAYGTEQFTHDLAFRMARIFAVVEPVTMFLIERVTGFSDLGMMYWLMMGSPIFMFCFPSGIAASMALERIPEEVPVDRFLGSRLELGGLGMRTLEDGVLGETPSEKNGLKEDTLATGLARRDTQVKSSPERSIPEKSISVAAHELFLAGFITRGVGGIMAFYLAVANALALCWFQQDGTKDRPKNDQIPALVCFWLYFGVSALVWMSNRRRTCDSGRRITMMTVFQGLKFLLMLHGIRLCERLLLGISPTVGLFPTGGEPFRWFH